MENRNNSKFWSTIWDYAGTFRKNLMIAMILSVLVGIFQAIKPIMVKHLIDDGISNTQLMSASRMEIAAIFAAGYILSHLMQMLSWGFAYRSLLIGIEGFLFNIRSKFFGHIQNLCMRFYDKNSSGELFNYIMGSPMTNLKTFLSQFSLSVPHQIMSMIISVCALLTYDWLLTIVMVLSLGTAVLLNRHSRKRIRKLSSELLQSESEASKYIGDMLHGNVAVKLYAIENEVNTSFESRLKDLKNKGIKLSFSQWIEIAKPEFIQYAGIALVYLVGAFSCIYRDLTVGELTAFVSSMTMIMGALSAIFNIELVRSNAEASLTRIKSVMDEQTTTPESGSYHSPEIEKKSAQKNAKPCVEFKDISFGYNDRKIFNHFDCKLDYNKSFGIVGSSGSGKSTITKLLMRLYEVEEGEIFVHGCNIKKYSLHDLRKSIGIVPQEPFIFRMSIIDNIRIAVPDAPMIEIINAMEVARVHEFVNELPKGWNTIVGDGGFGLSGGQKQRIAIARAILGKPDILIFDEATSALDNVSERHIQNAIDELMQTHTVIIVAHRLTTIKNVDEILVFEKGNVIQRGNFDELSNQEGMFRDMLMSSEDKN